ncbi:MAG: class I SAM-dependent methyltransferase [Pseudomonadales bacterium]|nr:class I SAM-dependent methyltransferase [Pseudomonadales bacterium]
MQDPQTTLNAYYEVISKDPKYRFEMGYVKETNTGVFIPSSIDIVRQAFRHLIEGEIMDPLQPFLDAGCGDGRIVALATSLGIPAWGIESDEELVALSKQNLINLRKLAVLNSTPARIHRGNFAAAATYQILDKSFSEFGTVYNYTNNHEQVGEMIARHSPPGTLYILYSGDEQTEEFPGLTLLEELFLVDQTGRDIVDLELDQAFVRIYDKT